MLAALICLSGQAGGPLPEVGGRLLSAHQADLALVLGCDLVLAYGHGATAEAVTLRQRVEAAGARFQVMASIHALPGAVGAADNLLVLEPGVLPATNLVQEALAHGSGEPDAGILAFAAGAGVQAGFERIDLERAWAGVLVMPTAMLALLDGLPEDAAPASALLRIALQQHVPERRLPDAPIDSGEWVVLRDLQEAQEHEGKWLQIQLGPADFAAPSRLLAHSVLRLRGGKMLRWPRTQAALYLGLTVLPALAIMLGWLGLAVAAFALLALAAPVAAGIVAHDRLAGSPAGLRTGLHRRWPLVRLALDPALAVCAVLALEGPWYRTLFAPVVLGIALALLDRRALPGFARPLRDRGVLALAGAMALALFPAEPALAGLALLVLSANLLPAPTTAGITRNFRKFTTGGSRASDPQNGQPRASQPPASQPPASQPPASQPRAEQL